MDYEIKEVINKNNKGKVSCNRDILLSIVNLASKEIAGVSSLRENLSSGIKKLFSNNYTEGVKITNLDDGVIVDIYLNVWFGYSVNDVAYRVQENVKNGISAMMEIKVNSVNVHVLGVDFKKVNEDK